MISFRLFREISRIRNYPVKVDRDAIISLLVCLSLMDEYNTIGWLTMKYLKRERYVSTCCHDRMMTNSMIYLHINHHRI